MKDFGLKIGHNWFQIDIVEMWIRRGEATRRGSYIARGLDQYFRSEEICFPLSQAHLLFNSLYQIKGIRHFEPFLIILIKINGVSGSAATGRLQTGSSTKERTNCLGSLRNNHS